MSRGKQALGYPMWFETAIMLAVKDVLVVLTVAIGATYNASNTLRAQKAGPGHCQPTLKSKSTST